MATDADELDRANADSSDEWGLALGRLTTLLLVTAAVFLALSVIDGLRTMDPPFAYTAARYVGNGFGPRADLVDRIWTASIATLVPALLLMGAAVAVVARTLLSGPPATGVLRAGRTLAVIVGSIAVVGLVTSFLEPIYPRVGFGTSNYFASFITTVLLSIGCVGVFRAAATEEVR